MTTKKNISLLPYNSFHIDVKAAEFVSVSSVNELQGLLNQQNTPAHPGWRK